MKVPSDHPVGQRRTVRRPELAPVAPLGRKCASSLPEATDQIGQSFTEGVWIGSNKKLPLSGSLPLAPHHLSAAGCWCEFHEGQWGAQPLSEILFWTWEFSSTNRVISVSLFFRTVQCSLLSHAFLSLVLNFTVLSRFCRVFAFKVLFLRFLCAGLWAKPELQHSFPVWRYRCTETGEKHHPKDSVGQNNVELLTCRTSSTEHLTDQQRFMQQCYMNCSMIVHK